MLLNILVILLLSIGLLGSILPVLPGLLLSTSGLLIYKLFSTSCLLGWPVIIFLIILVIIGFVLDYYLPIRLTKTFGGSKYATIGSILGLILGLFFMPLGIVIGPFIGVFIAELFFANKQIKDALKSSIGSIVGFILTTGYSFILSLVILALVLIDMY